MAEWTIWTDCQITRRKRFHFVTDPQGTIITRSRLFWDCVSTLYALEIQEYIIRPVEGVFRHSDPLRIKLEE